MPDEEAYSDHWVDIDAERLARYETMFQWSPAADAFYTPAELATGQIVADFGCGPGHTALEFAKRVGVTGHVHALDVNADFIKRTRDRADAAGLGGRITAHLLTSDTLPLEDASLDRVTARNTIIYVRDPSATLAEFRRVLKSGGIAHAIEGDWSLTALEPLGRDWQALVEAARWAWRTPEIGRKLYGIARRAGFASVTLQVLTKPDADGRLIGMIRNVADYAREGGMDGGHVASMLERVEVSIRDGTYLAVAPQFLVTAIR